MPLDSLRPIDGVFKAGYAGMTVAECVYCPAPQFSPAAVWRVKHGTVVAMIVVSSEGHVEDVKIVQSPDAALNADAITAIQNYKFRPAIDPDGKPTAVRMPFSLTFQIKN